MQAAIFVLCGFASAWRYAAIRALQLPVIWTLLPLVFSALLIVIARRTRLIVRSAAQQKRASRVALLWSTIEFVLIVVVANALSAAHHDAAIMPAIAIIVGLHFFPLAAGLPARFYYATGVAMVVLGAFSLLLSPVAAIVVASTGSAAILWATAIALLVFRRAPADVL